MPIEITIINSPSNANVAQTSHTFPDAGGTLGRGSDNLWILDDPNKYMSSVHAKIACLAEQYFLTDLSTNGTFVNGASEPIGNGNQVTLSDGDRFMISDYEFIANISGAGDSADIFASNTDPFADFNDFSPAPAQDDLGVQALSNNDPFSSGINETSATSNALSAFDAEQIDPLELLDNAQSSSDPFAQPVNVLDGFATGNNPQENHIPDNFAATTSTSIESNNVANDSINWPNANQEAGLIPDDWDDDDLLGDMSPSVAPAASPFSTPIAQPQMNPAAQAEVQVSQHGAAQDHLTQSANVTQPLGEKTSQSQHSQAEYSEEKYKALELQNQQLQQEIAQLKQQLLQAQTSSNTTASTGAETQSVVNAMGLAKWKLEDEKVAQINETVGHLMRETMQGMMRVLKFRKKIKEEFRINVTTIQSVENNPLKFSANIDDAMENMFIKENNAYKAPVDAVKEGFQGIAEHQVAVIAGMQAAFRGMIDRFEPNNLENRFEKYKSSSLLSLGQKGKRWNDYKQYHQGLVENLDDSFQHLFGYDFVQAYEEQMQRLISARLAPNANNDDEPTN